MPLTNEVDVRAAMGEPSSTDCSLAIQVASQMVAENLASSALSLATRRNIEMYLAAHIQLLAVENGPLAKKMISEVTEGYHDVYGPGLMSTRFGQMAILLDTTGTLAKQAQQAAKPRLPALFNVIGSGTTEA